MVGLESEHDAFVSNRDVSRVDVPVHPSGEVQRAERRLEPGAFLSREGAIERGAGEGLEPEGLLVAVDAKDGL